MLRTLFGKKENNHKSDDMTSASSITSDEFKEALGRYPALIEKLSEAGMHAYVT